MQISALDAIISNGGKVPDHDFKMLTEVLMQHLTELDRIHADGEAKVQRRIEVSQSEFLVDELLRHIKHKYPLDLEPKDKSSNHKNLE